MAGPWEKYGGAAQGPGAIPLSGPDPVQQSKVAAAPIELERERVGLERDRVGLERDRVQTEKARREAASGGGIDNKVFDNTKGLRTEFSGLQQVKDFNTVLPIIASSMQAPDTGQGDLAIIYGLGKVMDPGSVVREGELDLAQSTASFPQQLQQMISRVQSGQRLTPEVRKGLIQAMRSRASALADAYNASRKHYEALAQRSGMSPEDIIGRHPALPFQQAEANFLGRPVRNLDGSQGAAPVAAAGGPQGVNGGAGGAMGGGGAPGAPTPPPKPVTPEEMDAHIKSLIDGGAPASAIREYIASVGSSLNQRDQGVLSEYDAAQQAGLPTQLGVRTQQPSTMLGFTKGALYPLDRAAEGLQHGVNAVLGSDFSEASDVNAARQRYFEGVQSNPVAETIGKLAGGVAITLPLGGPITQGAVGGALLGDGDTAGEVITDAVIGGVGGKLGDMAVKGAARLIAPKINDSARRLAAEGVPLTPGQLIGGKAKTLEDRATSFPLAGDAILSSRAAAVDKFNRAAVDRVLKPIGLKLPKNIATGHDAVGYAQEQLNKGYREALSKVTVELDRPFEAAMRGVRSKARLPRAQAEQFDEIIMRDVGGAFEPQRGRLAGQDYKALDERLGDVASGYQRSDDPYQRRLGEAVADLRNQVAAMVRRQNPQQAAKLKRLDLGWAQFARVRDAASKSVEDGVFTPRELGTAVRVGDRSRGKGATARGDALMQDLAIDGSNVLPSGTGSSGTTERANLTDPVAWGMGAALSPLYRPKIQRGLESFLLAPRGPTSNALANSLEALPAGVVGAAGLNALLLPPGR